MKTIRTTTVHLNSDIETIRAAAMVHLNRDIETMRAAMVHLSSYIETISTATINLISNYRNHTNCDGKFKE